MTTKHSSTDSEEPNGNGATIGPRTKTTLGTVCIVGAAVLPVIVMLIRQDMKIDTVIQHQENDWNLAHQIIWAAELNRVNGTNVIVPDAREIWRTLAGKIL